MARVLLIGAARERAGGLRAMLRQDGHHVTWLRSLDGWRQLEHEQRPDVVVAAVESADALFRGESPVAEDFLPPLLLVQQESDFAREMHVEERLVDRLASPFMDSDLLSRIDALARVRAVVTRSAAPADRARSPRARGGLWSWLRGAASDEDDRSRTPYLEVAARLAEWSDRRDAFKRGHAERVTSFCAMIAESLGFAELETAELLRAAMLHDIGKVGLPIDVLRQRDPLDEQQIRLIRTHPARGAALLRSLDPEDGAARIVLYHHERPDGAGYYGKPRGVVPRAACALAVAEVYDAMTSSLLREQLTPEYALALLQSRKDSAWDGDCVEALSDHLRPRAACIPISVLTPA